MKKRNIDLKTIEYIRTNRLDYLKGLSKTRLIEILLANEEMNKEFLDKYHILNSENKHMREAWKTSPSLTLVNRRIGRFVTNKILDFKESFVKKLQGRKEWVKFQDAKNPSVIVVQDKLTGSQIQIHTSYPDRLIEILSECVENLKLGLIENK